MNLRNDGKRWSWEETLLAFDLYSRTPYNKISTTNKEVIALAGILERKPGAVAKKMFNIAAHDPMQIERGVAALSHSSKFDKQVWDVFEADTYQFAIQMKQALATKKNMTIDELVNEEIVDLEYGLFPYGQERERATKARIGQYFFRTSVLSAYQKKCCITGVAEPTLLVASHIKPWKDSDNQKEKTNPRNGLCLNSFHDKAFDRGLITISPDYKIIISERMKEIEMDKETKEWFFKYEKQSIRLPDKFLPGKNFIEYHNDVIFQR